jgi:TolB-like protein
VLLLVAALIAAAPAAGATPTGAAPGPAQEKPKLIVLDLTAAGGVDPQLVGALTEAVSSEVARTGYFKVLASKDVQTLLGLERQKQLLGCSEEAQSCFTELAGALGARFVMAGSVAKLGDAYQLSLQVLDSRTAQPVGRTTRLGNSLQVLRTALPYAIAEAAGTPPPNPPSRILPFSLIGGGGAVVIAGALFGLDGLSRERETNRELELADSGSAQLKPASYYRDAAAVSSVEKTVALGGLIAGAALVATGMVLFQQGGDSGAGLALVPTPSGVALVGVWP